MYYNNYAGDAFNLSLQLRGFCLMNANEPAVNLNLSYLPDAIFHAISLDGKDSIIAMKLRIHPYVLMSCVQ